MICAIIAAAGKGTRMNANINKLYIDVDNIPILARTIKVFNDCSYIDEIVLVINKDDIIYCKKNILDYYNFKKVSKIVTGGKTRQESVFKGLNEVNSNCRIVLIHDGARPFISERAIKESIDTANDIGASCVAVPVKDTIKRSDSENLVRETLDRRTLWSIQTPQTFEFNLIMDAHKRALEDSFVGTDDAVLVERLGFPLKLVMGSYDNIKITTREDLAIAETIIRRQLSY